VIPNFSLAGSVLSRNHGLATFAHERLEWSLVNQSPEQSETEWLCVYVAGYKIINFYKPPRSRFAPAAIPTFTHPSLYVVTSTANMSNGFTTKHLLTVRAWTPGQHPTTLVCCITKGISQLLSPMERRHQPRPGLREFRPGQPTAGQTCPRKVPAVTTSAFPYNATEAQGSCPQRSGEELELSQG